VNKIGALESSDGVNNVDEDKKEEDVTAVSLNVHDMNENPVVVAKHFPTVNS
jgi:hypothetical protein